MNSLLVAIGSARLAAASGPFPVIGIMSQPATSETASCGGKCEYIAASYVKFVELAGARAVPVSYYSTDAEIDDVMSKVNGVLFPGGGASLPKSAQRVVDNALSISSDGGHFPVYGACLGFEWIVEAVGGKGIMITGLDAHNMSLPLNLTSDGEESRLYGDSSARSILASKPVTLNNHQAGLSPAEYSKNTDLQQVFKVLSTNVDRKGREFVSSIEGHTAPIYGVQYHPEKNIFEWGTYPDGRPYEVIAHTSEAVQITQSIANFYVGEARRNANVFDLSAQQEWSFFETLPTDGDKSPAFVEVYYLFPRNSTMVV